MALPDAAFGAAGAQLVGDYDDVWAEVDRVFKVKEPVAEEYHWLRKDLVLFTYFQPGRLPGMHRCPAVRWDHGQRLRNCAVARRLPAPAHPHVGGGGAHHLQVEKRGPGVLPGGVPGVYGAKVVVLGAGVSGMNAAAIALGTQAEVLIFGRNIAKLRETDRIYQGHMQTVASNAYEIEKTVIDADPVGAVLVPEAKAPNLVSTDLVSRMKPGSVLVDISIDQGGSFEDSRGLSPHDPR